MGSSVEWVTQDVQINHRVTASMHVANNMISASAATLVRFELPHTPPSDSLQYRVQEVRMGNCLCSIRVL